LQESIQLDLAAAVDGGNLQRAARLIADHLPGDDVGVMLEAGDQDLIARPEARACIRLGDEIYALGRAADEDDLTGGLRIDEPAHPLACALVRLGRGLAQRMDTAM